MIEIKCTALEKKRLQNALLVGMSSIEDAACLFPRSASSCIYNPNTNCKNCLEKKIKWVVTDTIPGTKRKECQHV